MKNSNKNIADKDSTQKARKSAVIKAVKILAIVLGCLIGLIFFAAVGLTLWLTPKRIAGIINEEAGKYVNADVHVSSVDYHIWRTFPFLEVELDSISIKSHSLNGLPDSIKSLLPPHNENLLTCSKIKGSINLPKLFKKDICLGDLEIENFQLNAVQVNDSISNFNLLSREEIEKLKKFKITGLDLDGFVVKGESAIRYENIAQDLRLSVLPRKMEILRDKNGVYAMNTSVSASMAQNKSDLVKDFPISLKGTVLLPSSLKSIGLKDLNVKLKDIGCTLNISAEVGNNIVINSFDYRLAPLDIIRLLAIIPQKYLNGFDISGIRGNMLLASEGKLTKPYLPIKEKIPSVQGRIALESNGIRVPVKDEEIYLKGIAGNIGFIIYGDDAAKSCIDVKKLSISGEGLKVEVSAKAKRILTEQPHIEAGLALQGRLENIGRHVPRLSKYLLKGESESRVNLSFGIKDIKNPAISDLLCDAEISMKDFAVKPDGETTAGVKRVEASLHGRAERISSTQIAGIKVTGNVKTDKADLSVKGMSLKANALRMSGNYKGDKGGLKLSIDSVLLNQGTTLSTRMRDLAADGSLNGDRIAFGFKTGALLLSSHSADLSMKNLSLAGSAAKPWKSGKVRKQSDTADARIYKDESTLGKFSHTPDRIRISLDPKTKEILNGLSSRLSAKIESGLLTSRSFPVYNRFSDIDITSDIDHTRINSLKFHSGGCTIGLSGDIDNLTGFLSSPDGRENLHGRLRLEIDTLDIPRIARIYENGVALTKGIKETLRVPKPPVDKSDCKTLLIPRNLDIAIEASANHLLYTDLDMTDITTTLSVKNGLARIGDLAMHTAFGRGVVDVVYSSADIDRLNLGFTADITDVNLVDFFDCYRNTLLKAMPYMSNFSGDLSAKAGGQIALFPSMYFNVPSMTAYMNFRSRNLTVHQNKFIRHITRLMLIHTSKDIHIPNLKINANVHDNLVELDPFYFIFNRYTLNFSGINNFDGDMFYHIAVDRSPIPFKFGINLKGTFTHPEIRLGGPKLKADDTEKVAAEIMEDKRINMIQNLKYGFIEFLKMAAIEDTTGNQDYIFPVLVEGK